MTIKFSDLAMLAQQSRRDNGYQGGVVVFFQGKEAGWMNELYSGPQILDSSLSCPGELRRKA